MTNRSSKSPEFPEIGAAPGTNRHERRRVAALERRLLSLPQFAEELGITVACARRWVLERKIAYVKLGRLVRVPVEEIGRLVRAGFRPAMDRRGEGLS